MNFRVNRPRRSLRSSQWLRSNSKCKTSPTLSTWHPLSRPKVLFSTFLNRLRSSTRINYLQPGKLTVTSKWSNPLRKLSRLTRTNHFSVEALFRAARRSSWAMQTKIQASRRPRSRSNSWSNASSPSLNLSSVQS